MTSKSIRTSFYRLTARAKSEEEAGVERIEIPVFQRDYAQGRAGDAVERIRSDFLDTLRDAVAGDANAAVGLDFVYGGVDSGTLRPLDGQQRLTTLFLLHWYIASGAGSLHDERPWKNFSYATRQSARMFCESLICYPLPNGQTPASWIADQPWYLFLWRHDPTIQSMLVMLDAIHERFKDLDPVTAWTRLTDDDSPAIWFLFLPLAGLRSDDGKDMAAEDLYIKMNSRGKPLTEFENFKARFETVILWSPRASDFALQVDTTWSDLLWHLRGDDDLIDDEFLRYLEFVTEICEWRDGRTDGAGHPLIHRAREVFGESPNRSEHLDFLFHAFEVWLPPRSIADTFDALFTHPGDAETGTYKVRLFFRGAGSSEVAVNLFEVCCRSYGEMSGRTRLFSLGQTVMLYAVLLHLVDDTPDFARRLRVLRNLVEASTNELRLDRMPMILDDVRRVVCDGAIDRVTTLNRAQVDDERQKATFLAAAPELSGVVRRLEDHELLRGSLCAFDLHRETLGARASAFRELMSRPELWSGLVAALLAVGEYQRLRTNSRKFLFGTDSKKHDSAWRELLTGPPREVMAPTREVLGAFLDHIAASPDRAVAVVLTAITDEYLSDCEARARFDWRYYMVKYASMRDSGSSTYVSERIDEADDVEMGYSLCMLQAGHVMLGGYYRDPYLLAIWREIDEDSRVENPWFTGSEHAPRRLVMKRTGASIRCVRNGFALSPPPPTILTERRLFDAFCADLGLVDGSLIQVAQDDENIDTVDRIRFGADIVRRMLASGL